MKHSAGDFTSCEDDGECVICALSCRLRQRCLPPGTREGAAILARRHEAHLSRVRRRVTATIICDPPGPLPKRPLYCQLRRMCGPRPAPMWAWPSRAADQTLRLCSYDGAVYEWSVADHARKHESVIKSSRYEAAVYNDKGTGVVVVYAQFGSIGSSVMRRIAPGLATGMTIARSAKSTKGASCATSHRRRRSSPCLPRSLRRSLYLLPPLG